MQGIRETPRSKGRQENVSREKGKDQLLYGNNEEHLDRYEQKIVIVVSDKTGRP